MNHVYVPHPDRRVPTRLCPRDEIAHPYKIEDSIFAKYKRWRTIKIEDHPLQYKRIEYDREIYDDVSASYFYVVTDNTSVLKDAKLVRADSADDMFRYLRAHQTTLFLVTTPVFVQRSERALPDSYYVVPADVLQVPIFIEAGNTVVLRGMLHTRCYTVCNGMTVFLAMVRAGVWNIREARAAMERWRAHYSVLDVKTGDMSDVWQLLYVTHPIPMIAEFPIYYATMYPSTPESFFQYLEEEEMTPHAQYMDENHDRCFYASPVTSMFPHFNRQIFEYYNRATEGLPLLLETPFGMDPGDEQNTDIEGFLIAMVRSRRAWRWWKKNGINHLRRAWDLSSDSHAFFSDCLTALFYLYENPYTGIKYPRSRARAIWRSMLLAFDIEVVEVQIYLVIHLVKRLLYRAFDPHRFNPMIPLAFIADILDYYRGQINWFEEHRYKLYTTHDIPNVLLIFSPYIRLNNERIHEFVLHCSLYQMLKLDLEYHHAVRFLDRRVAQKLSYVNHIFGMGMNQQNLVNLSENSAYIVGSILKQYLRDHRNALI